MTRIITSIIMVMLFAAGCGADTAEIEATGAAAMTTISGELTYLQRIALIPGGTATITVRDTARQDIPAPVVAETTLNLADRQVPIDFELPVDTSDLPPTREFSLSASINNAAGELEWVTDTVIPVDLSQARIDVGRLVLVRVDPASQDPADAASLVGEWTVTAINDSTTIDDATPTLNFSNDGTLGGNASCNPYSTTYFATGDTVTLESEIAATLMACEPATESQERAFLAVLNEIRVSDGATSAIDGEALNLTTGGGATIEARR